MTERPLDGQIALVTGASRGFGFAAAAALGAAGAHVLAVARTVGGLEELDEKVRASGSACTLIPLDICDDPGLERMGAAVHARWGRVDLWLHTAIATAALTPAGMIDGKDLDRALAVNIRAFQRLIRVVDPLLRASENALALIAADGDIPGKFHGLHGATKAAQSALARAWAAEAAPRVTVAEVVPPPMPTAHRARFHPGEDRRRLTTPAEAAARLIARLAAGGSGPGARVAL